MFKRLLRRLFRPLAAYGRQVEELDRLIPPNAPEEVRRRLMRQVPTAYRDLVMPGRKKKGRESDLRK